MHGMTKHERMSYYYILAWREAGHRMTMVKLALVKGNGATYPFLPPLPFSQVGWEWVGGNWHSLVWLAYDFIFFSSVPQCSVKWLYLIPAGSTTIVENIFSHISEKFSKFQNLENQYSKSIFTLHNYHHTGPSSSSKECILKGYIFLN